MRARLPGLVAALMLLAAHPPAAQVAVNQGALDLLPNQAAPRQAARPRPAAPHAPARPAAGRPSGKAPPASPAASSASPSAATAKPAIPATPPAIAALPPPAPVPTPRPQAAPVVPVAADAPGAATPTAGGTRVTFGPDRQDLNPATEGALRELARRVRADQAVINIYAYAAGTADDPSIARRLSLARALAARAVLISEGIPSTRIYPRSLGAAGGDADRDRVDVVVGPPAPVVAPAAVAPAAAPEMTKPTTYLVRMVAFLLAMLVVAGLLSGALTVAFTSNPLLNSFIFAVLLIGIGWNLVQVTRLTPEVHWLETFQKARTQLAALPAPRLLAPMASMLALRQAKGRDGQDRFTLSAPAMRSLLDGLASRLDEGRELSRYMTGLLIFLGLLGTFWGLLLTVAAVSDVISGMSVGSGDLNALFDQLKTGLGRPLRGMGTAFSSSMFGLAGALVLGFLDLTAGQAQNRFYNELEEWLAGLTRLSSGALGGDGDASVPVYVQALLEQTAENMENLQSILVRGEDGRQQANQAIVVLSEKIATLSDTMRTSQQLMLRIAETQAQLAPALQRLGDARPASGGDEASRGHLRNIEHSLQRMLTEGEQGRVQSTQELRNDIRVLTRTIAALADGQPT